MCERCGLELDTIHHRLWRCQDPVACDAFDILFNAGIIPHHPAQRLPPPGAMKVVWSRDDGEVGIPGDGSSPPIFEGELFADGHCTAEECPELNRATWAIVQIDQLGNRTKWMRGTVPDIYPQTAQAGEFFAAMYSKQNSTSGATLHDDCLNVVNAFQREDWSDEKQS